MRGDTVTLAVALLAIVICAGCVAEPQVRGVRPDVADRYTGHKGTFTCLDGSSTLRFDQVNDDFCDCADGSDEPGTSACPNGVFFCHNRGSKPRLLSSSFVGDSICDCCDGTDELSGCSNVCLEESKARKQQLSTRIQEYQQALDRKQEYVDQAVQKRSEMSQRLASIDDEIEAQQAAIDHAKAEAAEVEARAQEQPAAAADDAQQRLQQDMVAAERMREALAASGNGADEVVADAAQAESPPADTTGKTQEELDREELGRQIAAQWTTDPEAAGTGKARTEAAPDHVVPSEEDTTPPLEDPLSDGVGQEQASVDAGVVEGEQLGQEHYEAEGEESGRRRRRGRYHGDIVQALETKLRNLEQEKADLLRQLNYDFGPRDVYLALLGRCLLAVQGQYTYEVCMFGDAHQREGHNDNDIGHWKGFEANYSEAVLDNGAYCWEGPNRSMRVHLKCGLEERLYDASEPAKCVYQSFMTTPAACTLDELDALRSELEQVDQLHREVAAQLGLSHDEL